MSWKEKLWAIGAYWGVDEEPCLYDDFSDRPYMLDFDKILYRMKEELEALQEGNSLAVSEFIRPTADHETRQPYRDPSPGCSESRFEQGVTRTHEGYVQHAEGIIMSQSPLTNTPLQPYLSSQEDPTPDGIGSPESRAVKERLYQALPAPILSNKERDLEVRALVEAELRKREIELEAELRREKSNSKPNFIGRKPNSKLLTWKNFVLESSKSKRRV
jgi:hypothetical protein